MWWMNFELHSHQSSLSASALSAGLSSPRLRLADFDEDNSDAELSVDTTNIDDLSFSDEVALWEDGENNVDAFWSEEEEGAAR